MTGVDCRASGPAEGFGGVRRRHDRPRGNRNALIALACGTALIGLTATAATAQQPVVIGGNGLPEVFVNMDVLNSLGPGYPAQPYGFGHGYGTAQPAPQGAPGAGFGGTYVTRPGTLLHPPPSFPQSQLTVQAPRGAGSQQVGALPMPQPRIQLTPPGGAAPASQTAPQAPAPQAPLPQARAPEPAMPPPPQPAPQVPVQTAESTPPPPPAETTAAGATTGTEGTGSDDSAMPMIPPPDLETAAPPPAAPQTAAANDTTGSNGTAPEPSAAAEPPPPPEPDVAALVPAPEPPAIPDTAAGSEQSEPLAPPPPALPPETSGTTESTAAAGTDTAAATQETATQEAALPPPLDDGMMRLVFSEGSADLNETAKESLRALAGELLDDGNARVQLLAYASNADDSASRARRLSLSRALAVRAFLIDQGVRSTRMDVRALGNKLEDGPADRIDILPARR